jgi:hypothetical protein
MKTLKALTDGLYSRPATFSTGSIGFKLHGKVVDENGVEYQLCGANLVKVGSRPKA